MDPLAGKREAINKGNGSALFWADRGECPVEVGDVLAVKIGGIEIVRKERLRKDGSMQWRADFIRIRKSDEKPQFLKRGGGYTDDPDLAMPSQDASDVAGTLDALAWEERSEAHRGAGAAPEGQAVPDYMIATLKPSREAQQRYELEMTERRIEETALPLSQRLKRLEECDGPDLTRQFARIREGVAAAEAKRHRLQPENPSDKAS